MSRSRNIKPGFWLNEELAACSLAARLLFPGLWCLADKDGRLEYRPAKIKAQLFPYDNLCVISLAAELHGKKFISVYENEGKLYVQVNNFIKHQNPHPKEKSNSYPEPINICEYDVNLKQFNFTASNVQIPFPSSSLIPSSLIPEIDTTCLVGQQTTQPQPRKIIPFSEIISYLNEKTGTNFKPNSDTTKRHIKSRWNEGFRVGDFKKVIDSKFCEWGKNPDMIQYLRPQTLFGTKFESYLQSASKGNGEWE
jgi:uncharacterized phage protein (TIGR02220 family)